MGADKYLARAEIAPSRPDLADITWTIRLLQVRCKFLPARHSKRGTCYGKAGGVAGWLAGWLGVCHTPVLYQNLS